MCFHNYTRHGGCGHLGELHTQPWTLCAEAEQRLWDLRGPRSPMSPLSPLSPTSSYFPPPKRTLTGGKLSRRFTSMISRNPSTASTSSHSNRRAVSGPSRTSASSFGSTAQEYGIADHELAQVRCEQPDRRELVNGGAMDVCTECKKWIDEMRSMILRYDKVGSVSGTMAFKEFLKDRGMPEEDSEEWEA